MLKSLCLAFTTYSRIPVPRVEWTEENMRWCVCFFPLIGVVLGAVEFLWMWLAQLLSLPVLLRAAVAAALPILLTGGIHLDGYCDTVDALSSHQSRERRLEILKDPNAGAFAVIFLGVWLLLYFAGWCTVGLTADLWAVGLSFVLSRSLSGLALANWTQARRTGMLRTVADAAKKKTVTAVMVVYIIICIVLLPLLAGWRGALVIAVNALVLLWYRLMSYSRFGGVTGDLAGCFLSLAELGSILILAITEAFA